MLKLIEHKEIPVVAAQNFRLAGRFYSVGAVAKDFCRSVPWFVKPSAVLSLLFGEGFHYVASIACACSLADLLVRSQGPGSLLWKIRRFDTFRDRRDE
jgi:hypothetical protein